MRRQIFASALYCAPFLTRSAVAPVSLAVAARRAASKSTKKQKPFRNAAAKPYRPVVVQPSPPPTSSVPSPAAVPPPNSSVPSPTAIPPNGTGGSARPRRGHLPIIISGVIAGGAACALLFYCFAVYRSLTTDGTADEETARAIKELGGGSGGGGKGDGSSGDPSHQVDVTHLYDALAAGFDAQVASTETWTGISLLRRSLVRRARGDVLECGAGTGRNARWYDERAVRSLTLADRSEGMLDVAKRRWAEVWGDKWERTKRGREVAATAATERPRVRWLVADLEDEGAESTRALRLSPSAAAAAGDGGHAGYDTIVSTFTLCSTPDPAHLLRRLCRLLRPAPTGPDDSHDAPPPPRLLLLEHGRSRYAWLNALLDRSAARHALRHGCWWNRDIGRVLAEAGLEVTRESAWHAGTTRVVEAVPGPELRAEIEAERRGEGRRARAQGGRGGRGGWFGWWR